MVGQQIWIDEALCRRPASGSSIPASCRQCGSQRVELSGCKGLLSGCTQPRPRSRPTSDSGQASSHARGWWSLPTPAASAPLLGSASHAAKTGQARWRSGCNSDGGRRSYWGCNRCTHRCARTPTAPHEFSGSSPIATRGSAARRGCHPCWTPVSPHQTSIPCRKLGRRNARSRRTCGRPTALPEPTLQRPGRGRTWRARPCETRSQGHGT
mmetsp:Transcript_50686/g.114797  ORF Transcript_50686/g.114797 Transcript_50686/m.114797 type:complete len:211 (-) Transcript_50686:687-1319(-)